MRLRPQQLFQLEEKDTASKLDMLFSKNLYPMAITLASANNYDTAAIIEIYQKFGDHLYRCRPSAMVVGPRTGADALPHVLPASVRSQQGRL